jgi:hypothetical protein
VISKTTIWRRLKNNDYLYGHYESKPKLTEKHKTDRLAWAHKYSDQDWSKINFSDEATIYLNNENTFCWYIKGNRKIQRKVSHSIKFNVWAFISLSYGLGDYKIFSGNLNAERYEEILAEHLVLFCRDEYLFQHDNSSIHTAKIIKGFLTINNISTIDWPANSPDLNPIENYWKLVKEKLSLDNLTKENFEEKIREALESIDVTHIYNMISSMHIRLQKVIAANGDSINY